MSLDGITFFVFDFNDRSFKVLDLNGNYLGSYNPESMLERPGPVCVSNILKEIYIQDHVYEKVFVYDTNFNYLREFGDERCQTPFGSCLDEATNKIYLSAYLSNIITIWDTQSGDFINDIEVYSPTFMHIFRNKLIVMSATESEIFNTKASMETAINNKNSIYIYNKFNYQILNKIKITNCIHPKGIFVDDCMNIYLTAYDLEDNKISHHEELHEGDTVTINNDIMNNIRTPYNESDNQQITTQTLFNVNGHSRYLFKITESGEFVQKTNLNLSGIFSMVIVDKKMYAIRGYRTPPIHIIEFDM